MYILLLQIFFSLDDTQYYKFNSVPNLIVNYKSSEVDLIVFLKFRYYFVYNMIIFSLLFLSIKNIASNNM